MIVQGVSSGDGRGGDGASPSVGGRYRWQEDPALRAAVPVAETLCGSTFDDPLLAVVALHPHLPGFSRLEFLGDAVLNLSIFTAAGVTGASRVSAIAAVSNDHLDACIEAGPLASDRRSGDVLEALIGAVHLDAGFAAAWMASLRLVGTSVDLPPDLPAPPETPGLADLDHRWLAFVGAALLGAAVADELCRTEPGWSHQRFSDGRQAVLESTRLATLARQHLASRATARPDHLAVDALQVAAAEAFVRGGWVSATTAVRGFGVLAS